MSFWANLYVVIIRWGLEPYQNGAAYVVWDRLYTSSYLPSLDISFTFPFYGNNITKIIISTGGFLYMSPFLHQWLSATQYIAPLMGNFATSLRNSSTIYYKDYGTKLVVEWRDIHLHDQIDTGMFRFQAILYRNGSIVFLYKQVPVPITHISTENHPVKIGVSDAFYMDLTTVNPDTQESYRRRTIYEYHNISVDMQQVHAGTVVFLHPLPTCNTVTDCKSCVVRATKSSFECRWCSAISRCSDGIDWHRQQWMTAGCIVTPNSTDCPGISESTTSTEAPETSSEAITTTSTSTTKAPTTPKAPITKISSTTITTKEPTSTKAPTSTTEKPTTQLSTTSTTKVTSTKLPTTTVSPIESTTTESTTRFPVKIVVPVIAAVVITLVILSAIVCCLRKRRSNSYNAFGSEEKKLWNYGILWF